MPTNLPRLTLTRKPEWEAEFDELKHTMFYNKAKGDMLRYLIELGLVTWRINVKSSPIAVTTGERH